MPTISRINAHTGEIEIINTESAFSTPSPMIFQASHVSTIASTYSSLSDMLSLHTKASQISQKRDVYFTEMEKNILKDLKKGVLPKLKGRKGCILKHLYDNYATDDVLQYLLSLKGYGKPTEGGTIRAIRNAKFASCVREWQDKLALKRVGSIVELVNKKYDPYEKRVVPKNQIGKWFGIEIECFLDTSNGNEHNLAMYIKKEKIPGIEIHHDGSLDPSNDWDLGSCECDDDCDESCKEQTDFVGTEICVITNLNDFSNLKKITDWLKSNGARVNSTCGLHVHLDMRNKTQLAMERAARRVYAAMPVLINMLPTSRRANDEYCKYAISNEDTDRYAAINKESFNKHGTLEIRVHSGTTDFEKITNWATILHKVANKNKYFKRNVSWEHNFRYHGKDLHDVLTELQVKTAPKLFQDLVIQFLDFYSFNENVSRYIISRLQKFRPELMSITALNKVSDVTMREESELAA